MHLLLPASFLLFTACGPKTTETGPTGGDDTAPECVDDDACASTEICDANVCVTGDRDALDNPTPLGENADGYLDGDGHIDPAGDVDWFSFPSEGGQFIRVDTLVDDEDLEDDYLDTIVTIYSPDGTLLAQEDEHPGGNVSTYDSVAYAWLSAAGTYTVSVEDKAGRAAADVTFTVTAKDLGDGGAEPDSLQSSGLETTLETADSWYSIPVVLQSGDDASDYVRFDTEWSNTAMVFVTSTGLSASTLTESLTLYNSDGQEILAKQEPTLDDYGALINSQGDTYVLKVTDAGGGTGETYWGVIFALVREEGYGNDRESEPNDTVVEADTLDLTDQEPDIGTWVAGYGSGHIDTLEDVDVWGLTIDDDDSYVSVFYGAQQYGGQLVAAVDVLDSEGNVVAGVEATAGADEYLWNAGPFAAGEYYVRFGGTGSNTGEGEGAFYQFAAHASTSQLE